jgi:hypothetical protein
MSYHGLRLGWPNLGRCFVAGVNAASTRETSAVVVCNLWRTRS